MNNDPLRRCDINRLIPAEEAIRQAVLEVEKLPADERLTEVVVQLSKLQWMVADWAEATGNVKPDIVPRVI